MHTPSPRLVPVLAAAALTVAMLASGCGPSPTAGGPRETGRQAPRDLGSVEVTRYEGQRLGSTGDFRENSIKGPQSVDISAYRLRVGGSVASPKTYTYAQVLERFEPVRKLVQIDCVEGWSVKALWDGVRLSEVIDAAKPEPGADTVIFHAADGYTTSLSLAYIRERDIVLAHKINGTVLPSERGFPFAVVAEDKWGYKWCRWVERIELSRDSTYRGYWESQGYSRNGDRDKSFFAQ